MGGESVAGSVFNVDDIETTWMLFTGLHGTDATYVLTAGDHADVTSIEFNPVGDFTGFDVDFDGVTDFAVWVGVADGATVVGREEWNIILSQKNSLDLAQFVLGFASLNSVDDVSTFGVQNQTEVFIGLVQSDDIHETSWVFHISSYFTVNFDHLAHIICWHSFPVRAYFKRLRMKT